mgnify:CR=1 FL=1
MNHLEDKEGRKEDEEGERRKEGKKEEGRKVLEERMVGWGKGGRKEMGGIAEGRKEGRKEKEGRRTPKSVLVQRFLLLFFAFVVGGCRRPRRPSSFFTWRLFLNKNAAGGCS